MGPASDETGRDPALATGGVIVESGQIGWSRAGNDEFVTACNRLRALAQEARRSLAGRDLETVGALLSQIVGVLSRVDLAASRSQPQQANDPSIQTRTDGDSGT